MKVKYRKMFLFLFGIVLAWYALWFMLVAFYGGSYRQQGSWEGGIWSVLILLSSAFLALGLTIEETAVEELR